MSGPEKPFVEVCKGARRRIVAYRAADGTVPALTFLQGLPPATRGAYLARMHTLAEIGKLQGKHFHPLDPKKTKNKKAGLLSEFKDNPSQTRVMCFNDGDEGVLVLTHGFGGKKENDLPQGEIGTALRIRDDYFDRKP